MSIQDDAIRASARALIRVLIDYRLDGEWGGPTAIWRDLATLGQSGNAVELQIIARRYAAAAAAAFRGGVRNKAPQAALFLALATFSRVSPAYRFFDSSRWIALMFAFMANKPVADPGIHDEILSRLENAFDAEMCADYSRVSSPNTKLVFLAAL